MVKKNLTKDAMIIRKIYILYEHILNIIIACYLSLWIEWENGHEPPEPTGTVGVTVAATTTTTSTSRCCCRRRRRSSTGYRRCHLVSLDWRHRAKVLQDPLTECCRGFGLNPRESIATYSVVQIDDDGGSSSSSLT
jgi:hypothetical protein